MARVRDGDAAQAEAPERVESLDDDADVAEGASHDVAARIEGRRHETEEDHHWQENHHAGDQHEPGPGGCDIPQQIGHSARGLSGVGRGAPAHRRAGAAAVTLATCVRPRQGPGGGCHHSHGMLLMQDSTAAVPGSVLAPEVDVTAQATTVAGTPTDLGKTGEALGQQLEVRSIAVTGLFVLALFYTLYFARAFILPILLAILLNFLLSPVVRALKRLRIPVPLGAGIIVLALVGGIGYGVYRLSGPAQELIASAPASMGKVQVKLRSIRRPIDQVSRTADKMAEATNTSSTPGQQQVVVKGPSLSSRLFGTTREIITGFLEVVLLLYFLLA